MQTGVLERWVAGVGDEVLSVNVICDVRTSELTEDPDDGSIVLEIESHEARSSDICISHGGQSPPQWPCAPQEGYLAKILLAEGQAAEPDVAMCVAHQHTETSIYGEQGASAIPVLEPTRLVLLSPPQSYCVRVRRRRACLRRLPDRQARQVALP